MDPKSNITRSAINSSIHTGEAGMECSVKGTHFVDDLLKNYVEDIILSLRSYCKSIVILKAYVLTFISTTLHSSVLPSLQLPLQFYFIFLLRPHSITIGSDKVFSSLG